MKTLPSKATKSKGDNDRDWLMVRYTEELFAFNQREYWFFRASADNPRSWAVAEKDGATLVAKDLESIDAAAAVCMELCLAKPTMSRELAIKELRECQSSDDPEEAHAAADGVLCALLAALGYEDVVLEYTMVTKWYA